jgi:glycosyltransferase involved in cell wall biosynthesis
MAYRSIVSALAQTYDNIEVVVSDDASTDDTIQRLGGIHSERMRLFEQKRRLGLMANFDFCLRNATGEYFLLLGDDDELLPTAIEKLMEPFRSPEGHSIGVAWCPCRIVGSDGALLWTIEASPRMESAASMLSALFAGDRGPRLSGILLRAGDAIAVGGYEAKYGDLCDIGNWGRVALLHESVACIPDAVVQYANHHGSTTSQSKVEQWQQWARVVHADLLDSARASDDPNAERQIAASKRNFISGITLTILIQTVGKKGWIGNALRQVVRNPRIFFSRYMFHRATKDGWKLLRMRNCR